MHETDDCTTAQYADDVAFLTTNKRAASIKSSLQKAVKSFSKYARTWKLKLNPIKTESVFFTRRRATKAFPKTNIKVDRHEISWTKSTKYLGCILDQKLTMKKHVNYIIEKSGKCVKMLYSLMNRNSSLHVRNKMTLIKGIFRPILTYPAPILYQVAPTYIQKLQIYQNRLLKMAHRLPYNFPTIELHELADMEYLNTFVDRLSAQFEERSRYSDNPEISNLFE